jgi:DNA-binding transcriptional regulator/RsmH inhibitor MraZ
VTIGALNRVEIWCEDVWDAYSDVDSAGFDQSLARTFKSGVKP